jgi:AcrR family transcriptional regulator
MSALRDKILLAATNLFKTRGINATGVDTIVAVAGTTKMTMYKHFKSKESLILEVMNQSFQIFYSSILENLQKSKRRPDEKLQAMFDLVERWMSSPAFNGIHFTQASAEFPNEENPVHKLSAEHARSFRVAIAQIAREAEVHDPDGLAQQLALLIEGAVQAEQIKRGSGSIKIAKKAAKVLIENAIQKH